MSYLTAASALQMSQVVEKCVQAVSQYLSPTLALLKAERHLEEMEIQHPDGLKNQEERDAAEEGGQVVIQSKSRVSQGARVANQVLREVRDHRREVIAKIELSDDAACCLESGEDGEIQRVHTNKPSEQNHHITGARKPHTAVQSHRSSPTRGGYSQHEELVDGSQNQDEDAGEEQRGEEEVLLVSAQLQECGELMASGEHQPKSHCSGDELTDDSHSILVQRPYLCRRCDRVFRHLESYVGHLKEHRQYLCLVCGQGFSQKSSLTHHIRIHTGVKPFRCPLCHKTFTQEATLQDHLNLHTGDKPHECYYCAVRFAQRQGLRRHLKDIHGKSSLQNMVEEAVD